MCFMFCFCWCVSVVCFVVFFFKQKTAYEMRISDWSSDVCSSDLAVLDPARRGVGGVDQQSRLVRSHQLFDIVHPAVDRAELADVDEAQREIGRASWRERVCQYV